MLGKGLERGRSSRPDHVYANGVGADGLLDAAFPVSAILFRSSEHQQWPGDALHFWYHARVRSRVGNLYDTDLLLRLVLLIFGRSPRFAPVFRMAVAYPLSNRFRTGMTIAIFAIVIFSVIFMATLFKVNDIILTDTEQFTGGFDLRVDSSRNNPVDDLPLALTRQAGLPRMDYDVIASLTYLSVEFKQDQAERWDGYMLQAADDAYLENVDYGIGVMAEGYSTAAEIWGTVRDKPGYAVVDRFAVPSRTTTNIVIGGPSSV